MRKDDPSVMIKLEGDSAWGIMGDSMAGKGDRGRGQTGQADRS